MANRSVLDWPHGVSVYKPEKCYNGYTLVHGRGGWDPTHGRSIKEEDQWHLIDMVGRIVNHWIGNPITKRSAKLFERLANGNYLSAGGSHVIEQDWDGDVVASLPVDFLGDGRRFVHHDVQTTSEGHYLYGANKSVDAPAISKVPIWDEGYIEVTPNRDVAWEWHAFEHFDEFEFSDETKRIIYETGGGQHYRPSDIGDWLHSNTTHLLPPNPLHDSGDSRFAPGNLLSCSRGCNMIFIVDRPSGRVVWQWGASTMPGSRMWIQGASDEEKWLVGPHDAKMLHNGNILVYDNGGSGGYPPVVRFYTRLVEIDPVSGEIVWEYSYRPQSSRFLSIVTGGMQRLPNGNTLSLDTDKGRVFEITHQGEIVWEFINPRGGFYRTQRISYADCPEADPYFMETDGHLGVAQVSSPVPEHLGLPVRDTPDYCPV